MPGAKTISVTASGSPKYNDTDVSDSINVIVVEVASVTSDKDNTCIGCDITFTVTTNPAGYYDLIEWSGGGTPPSQSGGATFTTHWDTAGIKTVTATCCDSAKQKQVTIVEVASVTSDKDEECDGQNVTFTVTTNPSGFESLVSWSGGGTPATGTGATFTTKWSTGGTKTVTACCCSSCASKEVDIISELTVLPGEAYVAVNGTKAFSVWACVGGSATDVTGSATFTTSNGSFSGNTLTASSTPSASEGADWVKAIYQSNTTDAAHDCDLTVFDMTIVQPSDGDEFELSEGNYTKTPNITFKGQVYPEDADGTINWTLDLSWDPSAQRSGFTSQRTPTSSSGVAHTEVYEAEGGELEVKAYATVYDATSSEKTITVYVIGDKSGIPNATICTRVKNLYDPDSELSQSEKDKLADLNWTDGICFGIIVNESSTMQFYNGAVYNYPDTVRMPYVSDDNENSTYGDDNDGSHVGLMQVVTTKERAWNWLTNTEYGVALYHSKLHLALGHWQDEKDTYPDATKWTAAQLEDNTSGHYRYGAGRGWYLYWDENEKEWNSDEADESLKNYVDYVRAYACE